MSREDDDDDVDGNTDSMLGCREKRAPRANSSSSWSTTRSILNMMNIINAFNALKAEYVYEWLTGDGVHGGDGPDDDIGYVHHD